MANKSSQSSRWCLQIVILCQKLKPQKNALTVICDKEQQQTLKLERLK